MTSQCSTAPTFQKPEDTNLTLLELTPLSAPVEPLVQATLVSHPDQCNGLPAGPATFSASSSSIL